MDVHFRRKNGLVQCSYIYERTSNPSKGWSEYIWIIQRKNNYWVILGNSFRSKNIIISDVLTQTVILMCICSSWFLSDLWNRFSKIIPQVFIRDNDQQDIIESLSWKKYSLPEYSTIELFRTYIFFFSDVHVWNYWN